MSRLLHAWRSMEPERRLAAVAAIALLLTMFFPWYGLQSLNRKSGAIYSHNISAFGDVSFVEAAIFLVAIGVIAMLLARAEGRRFHMPGGDGTIVLAAGAWAGLLIFYRVFSRPAGDGYPVGIEWGFFLAFVAAGGLAFAGLRMRGGERPSPPLVRSRRTPRRAPVDPNAVADGGFDPTAVVSRDPVAPAPLAADGSVRDTTATPAAAAAAAESRRPDAPARVSRRAGTRAPFPPAPAPPTPPEQLSFDDPPTRPV